MKTPQTVPIADKPALSVEEAAQLTGFSRRTLYNEMDAGRLVARKSGTRTVILRADLDSWLAAFKLRDPYPGVEVGNEEIARNIFVSKIKEMTE